eukprot:gene9470-12759_t
MIQLPITNISTTRDIFDLQFYPPLKSFSEESDILIKANNFLLHPIVPIVACILYLTLSDFIFGTLRNLFGLQPKGQVVQAITVSHSMILAVYSAWTCYNSASIFIPYVLEKGFYGSVCDHDTLWNKLGLGFWITHFYWSKYYEFIDTWIIILKGRKPIFLQTFHHAGIVLVMWGLVATQSVAGGVVALVLNSFIHSLMYTYYTLAAFGYRSPLKHYLTQAQIIQFVIGIIAATPAHFIDGCTTPAQSSTLLWLQLFGVALIFLFGSFYITSYLQKKSKNNNKNE